MTSPERPPPPEMRDADFDSDRTERELGGGGGGGGGGRARSARGLCALVGVIGSVDSWLADSNGVY